MSNDSMHIPISERIADEFLSSLKDTLGEMTSLEVEDLYLYSIARDGVPVSYTKLLKPFLGQSRHYNQPEQRVYLDEDLFVLRAIREALIDAGEHGIGARVFLTSTGAYYDDDGEEVTLVTWDWPGADLEQQVGALGGKT